MRKDGDISYLNYINDKFCLKPLENTPIQIDLTYVKPGQEGPENCHGELSAIAEFLNLKNVEQEKLATISVSNSNSPDVLYACEGKIRIYNGLVAIGDKIFVYKEYASIDDVFDNYIKDRQNKAMSVIGAILFIRAHINKKLYTHNNFIDELKQHTTDNTLPSFIREFFTQFLDKIKDINLQNLSNEFNDPEKKPLIESLEKFVNDFTAHYLKQLDIKE